jgi:pimeloyl-ACP methyl ester carboxylesterase
LAVALNHHRAGTGEPLVLIHGIASRWQVWNPVLPRLELERDVIALDLPGFGASPMMPHDEPPSIGALADAVIELFDELGLERPHVGGNSLGGWLSLELAKRGVVRSATALSPAGFFRNAFELRYTAISLKATIAAAKLLRSVAPALLAAPAGRIAVLGQVFGHPSRLPPDDAVGTVRAAADAPGFAETLSALMGNGFGGGGAINVPVTVAWGERDHLLLPRQAARAEQLLPQARHRWLYDCGHVPTYDDPEQVARVLLEGSSA